MTLGLPTVTNNNIEISESDISLINTNEFEQYLQTITSKFDN